MMRQWNPRQTLHAKGRLPGYPHSSTSKAEERDQALLAEDDKGGILC